MPVQQLKISNMAKKKSKKKNIALIVFTVLLIVGVLAGGGYLVYRKIADPYTAYEVDYTEKLVANAATFYVPYSDGYMRVSRDGAEAVNSLGLRIWNVSYSMNGPLCDVNGNYAVIGDTDGRVIYITDGTGTVKQIEVSYAISEVECAQNGVAAVRMHDGESDYIRLVSFDGETLAEIKTTEAEHGYPLDIDLSQDGKRLVTSYLVIDGETAGGCITFYNFGDVGQNYTNRMTGVFKYGKMSPKIDFIDKNSICAFFDDGIKIYSCPEVPSLTAEITASDQILCADARDGVIVLMESGKQNNTVSHTFAYNNAGKCIFESTSNDNLDGVMIFGKSFLFYNDYACQILRRDNSVRYNGNFGERKIKQFISVNGKDKLLLFEEDSVSTMRLVKSGKTK